MAKLFASETAMEIALDAVRIHGGYGYSTEFDVERYFRDAPLMIVGEGTNEIQRNVIARQLVKRNPVPAMTAGPPAAVRAPERERTHRRRPAQDLTVARGDHPQRTPVLRRRDDGRRHDPGHGRHRRRRPDPGRGSPSTWSSASPPPSVGFVLTFRDYSQPRRRDGR